MDPIQMADMTMAALTKPRRKSYDSKCYDLASAFLEGHSKINDGRHRCVLAGAIQQAIEDEIEFMESQ